MAPPAGATRWTPPDRTTYAAPPALPARVGWFLLHLVVVAAPLAVAVTDARPGRGLVVDLSAALGYVALSVFGIQFVLAARWAGLTAPFGADVVLRYHRQATVVSAGAAFAHPALLFVYSRSYLALTDVVDAPIRTKLAWVALLALVLLVVTSAGRRVLRMSYRAWHVLHSLLAAVIVGTAGAHAFLVGNYMAGTPMRVLWAAYGVVLCWLLAWTRVIKPLRMWRRPYRVAQLWPEPGGCLTISLRPTSRHRGKPFRFHPGQFAWILTGRTPFTLTYHPFTISSSADREQLEFTVRVGGMFTRTLRRLHVGDTVYVDGPHGRFTIDRYPAPGFVFLATGVGVTPFLSMLATMADRGDGRPVWLFLGNRYEHRVVGVRQLSRVAGRVNLTCIHVISRPTPDWLGERGRISPMLVARHIPVDYGGLQFFVCASPRVTRALVAQLRALGVDAGHIHAEDFRPV